MKLLEVTKKNLRRIEKSILETEDEEFDNIFSSDEYLYKVMELTKNKSVFLKCMKYIMIPFLEEKVKDPTTSQEMIFKLTLHPHSIIKRAILKREDVTIELLKQILENEKDISISPTRSRIINHEKMDENTLYELSDSNNNQILSLILLSDKVSRRIIKKLQNSKEPEIATMAKVRDPETDSAYIEKTINKEIRKTDRVEGNHINRCVYNTKTSLQLTDILEAALKNPNLQGELLELFKNFSREIVLTLVIPHTNVTKTLLDYYYKNGDEEIQKAVSTRRGEDYIH